MSSAFNSDDVAQGCVASLIEKYNINVVFETGTYMGHSTEFFAGLVDVVHTIELNKSYSDMAKDRLSGLRNVFWHLGSSPVVLAELLKGVRGDRCLIFLDAHWYDYWPILDELKAIADAGCRPVLVIHDCFNPGRPEFGFDEYKGVRLSFELVEPMLRRIYGDFEYYFNDEAGGSKRGILYVLPKL